MYSDKTRFIQRSLFLFAIFINVLGLTNVLFMGDSALYACISKEMVLSGNWMDLSVKGMDWLDKPHFPFWVSALSFKILGIHAFAYKLPAFLFFMLSILFTWKLARRLYNTQTAELSVLILSTALHIIVSNNDVRAEPFLMGTLVPAMYYFIMLYKRYTLHDLILGALFAAAAIMTKGYFVLIPIVAGIGGHAIFTRQWKRLFHWKWLTAFALITLFILPEIYALYNQFDLHPEKEIFGRTNISGVKFFLWDSQFGRFFNNGPITGNGEPTFFVHTMLWAFAPWGVLAFISIVFFIKRFIHKQQIPEYFNMLAFLSMFLIFSVSKFQLPHYTNIIFPFISISVAWYLLSIHKRQTLNRIRVLQLSMASILGLFLIFVHFYFQPGRSVLFGIILSIIGLAAVYIFKQKQSARVQIIQFSVLASILFGLYINTIFYPKLLSYQAGIKAAAYANKNYADERINCIKQTNAYDFEFYLGQKLHRFNAEDKSAMPPAGSLVYTTKRHVKQLLEDGYTFERIASFPEYHITMLSPQFLNAKSREAALNEMFLIRMQ